MVSENLKGFAKAIENANVENAKELLDDIAEERREGISEKFEEVEEIESDTVQELRMRGYNTVEKLASASLEKLVKVPGLEEGRAKEVLESARGYIVDKFGELPGVGEETARELADRGYTSVEDIAKASVDELSGIPNIGKRGAEKILEFVEDEATTDLEDLPGVGEGTAEEMQKNGFTPMSAIAESNVEELSSIPNIGEKGALRILEFAEENPQENIEELPGVGEETAREIEKHGFTAMRRVAESSVNELSDIPNIGKRGAEKILKHARGKVGGGIEELSEVDDETAKDLEKHGYRFIEDIAKSSVEELVRVPSLRGGRAQRVLESAEKVVREAGGGSMGYLHALGGIVSGLESERELTLPWDIAEEEYSLEKLKEIKERMKQRASQDFRPPEERSYSEAWADILTALVEMKSQ